MASSRSFLNHDIAASLANNAGNLFTAIIVILCVLMVVLGQRGDALFLASTLLLNVGISTVQEVRAKQALRSLALLQVPQVTVLRDGQEVPVSIEELRIGDHVSLQSGDQVPGDGNVVSSTYLTLNQSLLTGEAADVRPQEGAAVFAGTAVTAGKGVMRITALKDETRAGKIGNDLRGYAVKLSPLQRSLSRLLRFLTYIAVFLSLAVYIDGIRSETALVTIVSTIASGALALVPQGLLLAVTLLLSLGALRMSRQGMLIQRLTALESLSRLQILCLDKTGTLTTDQLAVAKTVPLGLDEEELKEGLAFALDPTSENQTANALRAYAGEATVAAADRVPFSSARKWSAARYNEDWCFVGAPDVLLPNLTDLPWWPEAAAELDEGGRVLLLARGQLADDKPQAVEPLAWISLSPSLRPSAADTLFYLQAQGMSIKIISGDAPGTVQALAKKTGVLHADKAITGEELARLSGPAFTETVRSTTIFARVSPEQKAAIVDAFRGNGMLVGMVGDGVNDALALKRADVGIAMVAGSPATRQVADLVLMDNDFASLPSGIREGSKIIMSTEMVSSLFLNKIIASAVILIASLLLSFAFPFTPRHVLIINIFTIGIPTLIWSLIPARPLIRPVTHHLLRRLLAFTVPSGLIVGGTAVAVAITLHKKTGFDYGFTGNTGAFFATLLISLAVTWLIPDVLGAIRDQTRRRWMVAYTVLALLAIALGGNWQIATQLLVLTQLHWSVWGYIVLMSLVASGVLYAGFGRTKNRLWGGFRRPITD